MQEKNKSAILIYSGYNLRAIIAFIRTCISVDALIGIVARNEKDPIFLTDYSDRVLYIRQRAELDKEELLYAADVVRNKYGVNTILAAPSTEALNRFLLKNRDEFKRNRILIPLVDEKTYRLISDKQQFSEYILSMGMLVPMEIEINLVTSFPVVAKPKSFISKDGKYNSSPLIIKTKGEWNAFVKRADVDEFYIQEYVEGKSFYLLFYIDKEGKVFSFSQENIIQQPEGKSMIAARTAHIHNEKIGEQYRSIICRLDYRGFIMIELREHDGHYYMIEANPRFWGPSQLFVDAGYNFFMYFLKDYGLIEHYIIQEPEVDTRYFWNGGVEETKKNGCTPVIFSDLPGDIQEWRNIDVYNRSDTIELYKRGI